MQNFYVEKRAAQNISKGYPWVFRSQLTPEVTLAMSEPGELAQFSDPRGVPIAVGYVNPHPELSGRILSTNPKEKIDVAFFQHRFSRALKKREGWFDVPFYRLIHAEGDGFPGLIVDRFGEHLVCQVSTAGMEKLKTLWLEALIDLVKPKSVTIDASMGIRELEKLSLYAETVFGTAPERIEVVEHGKHYVADLMEGQKTGWFFDQRANREYVRSIADGKSVIDYYSHSGGFGIAAAMGGATHVEMVDRSALALSLAKWASEDNSYPHQPTFTFTQAEVFDHLDLPVTEKYEIVIADPPAFIKKRAHIERGLAAYKKLAHRVALRVRENGILCIASCSHHASQSAFRNAVEEGILKTKRKFFLIHHSGADKDHPVHPLLPESRYLKFLSYRLD